MLHARHDQMPFIINEDLCYCAMKVVGGCKVLTWLWSLHFISIGVGITTEIAWQEALVQVIGPGSSYIVYGYFTVGANFVIILEKHDSCRPLICVNMVKASIQVTEMSICQSASNKFHVR